MDLQTLVTMMKESDLSFNQIEFIKWLLDREDAGRIAKLERVAATIVDLRKVVAQLEAQTAQMSRIIEEKDRLIHGRLQNGK